ncbi:MAG: ATP-binding protein [Bacteroidota bacterium]
MISSVVNHKIKSLYIIGFVCCILLNENVYSQRTEAEFDSIYNKGLSAVYSNLSIAKLCLKKLESNQQQYSLVLKAKTNYLRLTIINTDSLAVKALEKRMFTAPDSLNHTDALLYSACKYLERSMPDKAISLLMKALDTLATGSEKAVYSKINLCEAYRQKQEYKKGVEMLNEILFSKINISDVNRAFAYNRLAALYNEWGNNKSNTPDSVVKYSELCISLSKKINSFSNLALSQNELSAQLSRKKKYDKALELSIEAVKNFKEAGLIYNAMNALINQSNIYVGLKKYDLALQVIEEASNLCTIEENRNLFIRIYQQFTHIYTLTENYKDALDILTIVYNLQANFYIDRISAQINEQSAKYDLLAKEQKIKEEKQKNEFHKRQLTFLFIILIFLCIAFVFSFFYFRLKRQELNVKKLNEAIFQSEENERKRIASDLHDGLGPLLSAAKLYFQAYIDAKNVASKNDIELKLKNIIENAISDTSRISHNISPYILEHYGLITALENFISDIKISKNIQFDTSFEKLNRFDLKEELTIYRTISELINNTIKHACASTITIKICIKNDNLHISYQDNGNGFSAEEKMYNKSGLGLINIQNRIKSLKGNISFESAANKGVAIEISIPYHELKNLSS